MRAQRWKTATLTPFLYQTRTIRHATNRFPVREQDPTRPRAMTPSAHVPFDHEERVDEIEAFIETKPSLTSTERKAFKKLFTMAKPQTTNVEPPKITRKRPSVEQGSTLFNQRREQDLVSKMPSRANSDHAQRFSAPLRPVVAASAQRGQNESDRDEAYHEDVEVRTQRAQYQYFGHEEHNNKEAPKMERKLESAGKETNQSPIDSRIVASAQDQHRDEIEGRMLAAETDIQLWNVLQTSVFSLIEDLDLDFARAKREEISDEKRRRKMGRAVEMAKVEERRRQERKGKGKGKGKGKAQWQDEEWKMRTEENNDEDEITREAETRTPPNERKNLRWRSPDERRDAVHALFGSNYSSYLVTSMRLFRQSFPSSLILFNILPTVKRFGRESYALGASTPLYNELIAATWHTYADFTHIDELLQEMVNGGLDFDEETLAVVDAIKREGNQIKKGRLGVNRKALWATGVMQTGWRRMMKWSFLMRVRVGDGATMASRELHERDGPEDYEFANLATDDVMDKPGDE